MLDPFATLMLAAIPVIALIGGLIICALALHHRARLKELAYRERLAMIERGLTPAVPPPEIDAAAGAGGATEPDPAATRHRTAGVILMGLGFALMFLIGFAGEAPGAGIGVGGAIAILGAAFYINSQLVARQRRPTSRSRPPDAAGPAPPAAS